MKLLTICSHGWELMHEITIPSKREYCERWGIELIDLRLSDEEARDCWQRPVIWKRELEKLFMGQVLFFLGADAMITNQTIDWHSRIRDNEDMVIGLDVLGINGDSFFIRKTGANLAMLDRVSELKGIEINEQNALHRAISEMHCNVSIKPQRWLNSYPYSKLYQYPNDYGGDWRKGDFVLHTPGLPYSTRLDYLREAVKEIVR